MHFMTEKFRGYLPGWDKSNSTGQERATGLLPRGQVLVILSLSVSYQIVAYQKFSNFDIPLFKESPSDLELTNS